MHRSILSLSKIAHQMWHDYPSSQTKMPTERAVGVGVGGDREVGLGVVWTKLEKGVWGVGNIGGGSS